VTLHIDVDLLSGFDDHLLTLKARIREMLYGVLAGSLAGALVPIGLAWLGYPWSAAAQRVSAAATSHRAPIVVALLAILALILERFFQKSAALFRSWQSGMVRGVSVVWATCTFLCWMRGHYWILFIAAAAIFQVLTEVVQAHRPVQPFTRQQIAAWIPRSPKSSVTSITFDKPIESWAQDAIGRQNFVETVLSRVLIHGEPAIGITADFGEGKSSVLHLIRDSINRGERAIAVPFRTWLPGSEEAFVDSLFGTATVAVRSKFFLPGWQSTFKKYRRAVLGLVPNSWTFLTDLLPPDSQAGRIDELTRLVSKLPVRVIFLLDEIDRMHAEELTILLKVLRGAPELTNVSYIGAFSKDAVARVLSPDDENFGRQYLEKFFPVELRLPAIDEDLRQYLFLHQIDAILEERPESFKEPDSRKHFDENLMDLWQQALKRRATSFRLLGQILRAFESSFQDIGGEVNAFDLLTIECVRLLLPDTYEFVYQNRQHFCSPPKGIERWSSDFTEIDEQARTKARAIAFNTYFKNVPEAAKNLALILLAMIFPTVDNYARENSLHTPVIRDRSTERRISDADFFTRYFTYAVPATRFGEEDMDKFIELVRDVNSGQLGSKVKEFYPTTERDDLRRLDFLRQLIRRAGEIGEHQSELLAVYLAEHSSDMRSEDIAYILTRSLVLKLASRLQGSAQLLECLRIIVLHADSDRFASDITCACVSARDSTDEISNWMGVDPGQISAAFGERMRALRPRSVATLQLSSENVLAFIRWRLYVPADVPHITDYFRSAFDSDIRNLGIFLEWLLPGNVHYNDGPIKFVDSFFPVSDVVERLKRSVEMGVSWTPGQRAAIERFWEFLNAKPTEGPNPVESQTHVGLTGGQDADESPLPE